LDYLGIKEVRDGAPDPRNQGQLSYDLLASAGIKFDFIAGRWPLASLVAALSDFERRHPGSISASEGVNEINNNPNYSYEGKTGHAAAEAYQSDLYDAIKADEKLTRTPVYNFTDYPDHGGRADFGNFHAYAKGGARPDADLAKGRASQAAVMSGKELVCTEFGYFTAAPTVGWGGVTERDQAAFLLRGLMENAESGVRRTYLYELLDAYPDRGNADQEHHFGLFDFQFRPKQSATSLRNLLRILRSARGGKFESVPEISVSNAGALVLRANAHHYFIALWENGAQSAHIRLPGGAKIVALYNPLVSADPTSAPQNENEVDLPLQDGLVIVSVAD
jgi:hypothetical protein